MTIPSAPQPPYTSASAGAAPKKKGGCMKWGAGIVGVFIVIGLFSSLGEDSADTTTASVDNETNTSISQAAENPENPTPAAAEVAREATPVADEPDNPVPTEHHSALRQADVYANSMHMSKQGLYDQLTSEYGGQFTAEAAQYAVDNVSADWNANALEKARTYQESMDMSPGAIYDQLISPYGEKFTVAEADFAIANL